MQVIPGLRSGVQGQLSKLIYKTPPISAELRNLEGKLKAHTKTQVHTIKRGSTSNFAVLDEGWESIVFPPRSFISRSYIISDTQATSQTARRIKILVPLKEQWVKKVFKDNSKNTLLKQIQRYKKLRYIFPSKFLAKIKILKQNKSSSPSMIQEYIQASPNQVFLTVTAGKPTFIVFGDFSKIIKSPSSASFRFLTNKHLLLGNLTEFLNCAIEYSKKAQDPLDLNPIMLEVGGIRLIRLKNLMIRKHPQSGLEPVLIDYGTIYDRFPEYPETNRQEDSSRHIQILSKIIEWIG